MPSKKLMRVLMPIQHAEFAQALFDSLRVFSEKTPAELVLLHVWEPLPFTPPEAAYFNQGQLMSYRESAERVAHEELEKAAEMAKANSLPVVTQVVQSGSPAEVILRVAQEQQADWIALSSHQRRGVERWFLGSVTERVVGAASVPVLVVPPN